MAIRQDLVRFAVAFCPCWQLAMARKFKSQMGVRGGSGGALCSGYTYVAMQGRGVGGREGIGVGMISDYTPFNGDHVAAFSSLTRKMLFKIMGQRKPCLRRRDVQLSKLAPIKSSSSWMIANAYEAKCICL